MVFRTGTFLFVPAVALSCVGWRPAVAVDCGCTYVEPVTRPCPGDFDANAVIHTDDYDAFLTAFGAMDSSADLNSDQIFNNTDINIFVASYVAGCDFTDTDGDRIPDIYENNSCDYDPDRLWNTGTDPNNPDTDGDNIDDGDEVYGTLDGLDLPGLNASPLRKDMFVEIDWVARNSGTEYKPSILSLELIVEAFSRAPISNPDGCDGIALHFDLGQGYDIYEDVVCDQPPCDPAPARAAYSGGTLIDPTDVIWGGVDPGVTWFDNGRVPNPNPAPPIPPAPATPFNVIRDGALSQERNCYFYYVLSARFIAQPEPGPNPTEWIATPLQGIPINAGEAWLSGGRAVITTVELGNDLKPRSDDAIARTLMHELGHAMGLYHGGRVPGEFFIRNKYNYPSIMTLNSANRSSGQRVDPPPGVDLDGDGVGDWWDYSTNPPTFKNAMGLDFSRTLYDTLNESFLIEANGFYILGGIPQGTGIDFNGNGTTQDLGAARNLSAINGVDQLLNTTLARCPGPPEDPCADMTGFDDWAFIDANTNLGVRVRETVFFPSYGLPDDDCGVLGIPQPSEYTVLASGYCFELTAEESVCDE